MTSYMYKKGPTTEPWGTPAEVYFDDDRQPFTNTVRVRLE